MFVCYEQFHYYQSYSTYYILVKQVLILVGIPKIVILSQNIFLILDIS